MERRQSQNIGGNCCLGNIHWRKRPQRHHPFAVAKVPVRQPPMQLAPKAILNHSQITFTIKSRADPKRRPKAVVEFQTEQWCFPQKRMTVKRTAPLPQPSSLGGDVGAMDRR